ncbi:hypothetical protein OF83DRAFT_380645 [Amylostereum chailletii]|nr:hypothetical protein OF83DRAFT_380645 [Amylostereum chailletii]
MLHLNPPHSRAGARVPAWAYWHNIALYRFGIDRNILGATQDPSTEELGEDVDAIARLLALSKQCLNNRRAIVRLPSEVLSHIFRILRDDDPPLDNIDEAGSTGAPRCIGRHGFDLGWIPKVTHVCARWRKVALEDRPLWDYLYIQTMSVDWRDEMLMRSYPAPIDLKYQMESGFHPEVHRTITDWFLGFLREHMARLRSLSVEHTWDHPSDSTALCALEAPLLESLMIGNDSQEGTLLLPWNTLPRSHALARLELQNCHIPWSSPVYTNLTSLEVDASATVPIPFPTVQNVNEMLGRMDRIRDITLRAVLPPQDMHCAARDGVPSPGSAIFLPASLRRFDFTACEGGAHPAGAIVFALCLVPSLGSPMPALAWRLPGDPNPTNARPNLGGGSSSDFVVPLLSKYGGASSPYKGLGIRCLGRDISVECWRKSWPRPVDDDQLDGRWPPTTFPTRGLPPGDIRLVWTLPSMNRLPVPSPTLYGVCLDALLDLKLDLGHAKVTPLFWTALFDRARRLRRLHVTDRTLCDLLPVLSSPDVARGVAPLLPQLKTLKIMPTQPRTKVNLFKAIPTAADHALLVWLRDRKAAGVSLEEILIPEDACARWTQGLREWVGNVRLTQVVDACIIRGWF